MLSIPAHDEEINFNSFRKRVLADYRLAFLSREISISGRKEVFSGRGKFGVFGDGKELAQIALSHVMQPGDFRSGYYRDQTWMLALGIIDTEQFFSQLYSNTDIGKEPSSGGRQMNNHFSSRMLDENGDFLKLTDRYNSSADISTTGGQIPRMVGLAQASKIYRKNSSLDEKNNFSKAGNEVVFASIGDASTSQGLFWEGLNAAGVMQIPIVLSIWDDGYGISVPAKYHHAQEDIYECLKGFQKKNPEKGLEILQVNGWDYPNLILTYERAEQLAREKHTPVVIHVKELTQQLGHTTSGSHERYKSSGRLAWEKEFDCLAKFEQWILDYEISDEEGEKAALANLSEIQKIQEEVKEEVSFHRKKAWKDYKEYNAEVSKKAIKHLKQLAEKSNYKKTLEKLTNELQQKKDPRKSDAFRTLRKALRETASENGDNKKGFLLWYQKFLNEHQDKYSSHLYSQSNKSFEHIKNVSPIFGSDKTDGRIIIRDNFDALLAKHPEILIFGEDVGKIGDVNQGLQGIQEKYGEERVFDTGIRESTIIGQGIGMSMRGLRPIAEIQYLDYVLFALETISDDLASLHYRTVGGQKAPLIIRTRGHRLEGIWHSGSPMAGLLNFMRGIHFLVPRNLTKAAGFYNALMQCDNPAIVIESLNGYRLKENSPTNLGEFTTPIGEVEVTKQGIDVSLITYGSTWRIVTQAAKELEKMGVSAEIIDIQSLSPFDVKHDIVESLKKTNRLAIVDEDVPGGASAYILQKILEEQNGYQFLDSQPITITAKEHRPPYSSDGDYFSKPSIDDVIEGVYQMMHEAKPSQFPSLF